MNWREYITVDPNVCHGSACIAGTRVLVTSVLDNLADGRTETEILASYPSISRQSIRAALRYAAEIAKEQVLALPD